MAVGTHIADRSLAMVVEPLAAASWLVVLPVVVPLIAAGLCLVLRGSLQAQEKIATMALVVMAAVAVALMVAVGANGPMVMAVGSWLPPFGIVFTVDSIGALFVLTTAFVGLAAFPSARAELDDGQRRYGFYSFYLLLLAGVSGAFSTGDLFNLYVWFEVLLLASFGLLVLGSSRQQLDGGVKYAVLSLVGTNVFLVAVGYVYGLTGALNMADIRVSMEALGTAGPAFVITGLFILGFAMKAAAVTVHFWLPASYHTPPAIVGAVFGGLLTKVGIYALFRIVYTILPATSLPYVAVLGIVGAVTAVVGVIGALAQTNLKRVVGFLVISGVGVMLIGIGIGSERALVGTITYAVHSMIATAALFLTVGAVERIRGVDALTGAGAVYRTAPALAAVFIVFGFALAGLPPFSGFWPKVILLQAAMADASYGAAAAIIVTGFLTTVAIGRVWILVFLREAVPVAGGLEAPPVPAAVTRIAPGRSTWVPLALFALMVIALGVAPTILIGPAERAADGLLDPTAYVRSVLGSPH